MTTFVINFLFYSA